MAVCLQDLLEPLEQIAAAVAGTEGNDAINISLDNSAEASSSSNAIAQAVSISNAVAYAESIAIALNFVDIDIRLEQTSIVNLLLPPVSTTVAPDLPEYPSAETGVTDTPVDITNVDGPVCQLLYQYLRGVAKLTQLFSTLSSPFYQISSYLYLWLELQMKLLGSLALQFSLPKQVISALVAGLAASALVDTNPATSLAAAAADMEASLIDLWACELYNLANSGSDTFELAEYIQNQVDLQEWGLSAKVFIKTLLGPSVFAAALYEPLWPIPTTTESCDSCGV